MSCAGRVWRRLGERASGESTIGCSDQPIIRVSLFRQPLYFVRGERRPVVILKPGDCDDRLTTSNVEAARAMLQLYPAEDMWTDAVSKT